MHEKRCSQDKRSSVDFVRNSRCGFVRERHQELEGPSYPADEIYHSKGVYKQPVVLSDEAHLVNPNSPGTGLQECVTPRTKTHS